MTKTARKALILAAKLLIAVAMLVWVISQVHWDDYVIAESDGRSYPVLDAKPEYVRIATGPLWRRGAETRPRSDFRSLPQSGQVVRRGFASCITGLEEPRNASLMAGACVAFLASMLTVAFRWRFLLRVQSVRIGLWEAVRLTFLGQFFNAVVPGTVGGDLVKAYYVSKHTPRKAAVVVTTFVDRMIGMTELALLAAVMVAVVWVGGLVSPQTAHAMGLTIAVVLAVVGLAFAFVLSRRFRKVLHLEKLYGRLPLAHHFAAAGEAARIYRNRIGSLAWAMVVTVLAHVTFIGSIALVGASLSLPSGWYEYFLYVPLIYIIGAVPVTPGGVGLVEKLYVVLFASAAPSAVLALALLARGVQVLCGLPGLVVAVTGPKLPKAQAIEAELGLSEST